MHKHNFKQTLNYSNRKTIKKLQGLYTIYGNYFIEFKPRKPMINERKIILSSL